MSDSASITNEVHASQPSNVTESKTKHSDQVASEQQPGRLEKKTDTIKDFILDVSNKYQKEIMSTWQQKGQMSGLNMILNYLVSENHLPEIPQSKQAIVRIVILNELMNITCYRPLILNQLGIKNKKVSPGKSASKCASKRKKERKVQQ